MNVCGDTRTLFRTPLIAFRASRGWAALSRPAVMSTPASRPRGGAGGTVGAPAHATALHTVSFEISGKVQGVFFRKHTKAAADRLHVVDWVANTSTGARRVDWGGGGWRVVWHRLLHRPFAGFPPVRSPADSLRVLQEAWLVWLKDPWRRWLK